MDSLRYDSRPRRALTLLLIALLELGIATVDARTPQDIPVSHLFYLPIVLGAWAFGYGGGIITAMVSLVLFSLANYVAHAPDDPGFYLFAAFLTLALYLGVGLGAATFFARQRRIAALGRQLAARVAELDTLYAVAHTLATEEALLPPLRRVLTATRELSSMPLAGIVPLGDPILATLAPADLRVGTGDVPVPLSPSLARHVVERGEPLLIADTTAGAVSGALVPPPWRALIALPIVVGAVPGGILYAAAREVHGFDAAALRTLETLARLTGDALGRHHLRAQQLDLALSGERNRLAREIHDTLAQSLLVTIRELAATRTLLPRDPARAAESLHRAETVARGALEEARRSVRGLRPAALDGGSLVAALCGEVAAFAEETGIAATFTSLSEAGEATFILSEAVEDGLYGIAREALTNIRKHADATTVSLALSGTADSLTLMIRDDGGGFVAVASGDRAGHFGLTGMRERARLLGGELALSSIPGAGTTVTVTVPHPSGERPDEERLLRVLLCDDHVLVRRGTLDILRADPGLAVVGEAGTGEEALALVPILAPDVLLLDLRLPGIDGTETVRRLQATAPLIAILLLTSFDDDPGILDALRVGARGCLLKDTPPAELLAGIRAVARGEPALAPTVAARLLAGWSAAPSPEITVAAEGLSARETEVLRLVAVGTSNKAIAQQLGITERTAKAHVSHILQKLGADDRTAAVTTALRRGMIEL